MKKHWNRFWWKLKEKLTDSAFVRHISFLWHWKNFFFLLKYPFYREHNRWTGKFMGYKYTEYDSIPNGWQIAFGKQLSEDIKKAGKESRKRLKKHLSWRKMLYWEQIKEKWGELCLYASATTEIRAVLDRYEMMSSCYCIECGKPARYLTKGYVSFLCEDCMIKDIKSGDKYRDEPLDEKGIQEELSSHRLTKKDLPKLTTYEYKHITTEVFDSKEERDRRFEQLYEESESKDLVFRKVDDAKKHKFSIKHEQLITHDVDMKKEYDIDFEESWGLK